MTDPDELYTLRAQYWLGHYQLAVEEARAVARRPMNPALKAEREELLARSYTALGQYNKVTSIDTPGTLLLISVQYIELSSNISFFSAQSSVVESSVRSCCRQ